MKRLIKVSAGSARLRLLPALIAVIVVALVLKAGSFAVDIAEFATTAMAQEANPEGAKEGTAAASEGVDASDGTDEAEAEKSQQSEAAADLEAVTGISGSERALLQDLRERRRELEKREQEAALREQLLASTERRIDEKIKQLQTLEKRIAQLVETHKAQENEQLAGIVKVYETMKPKDAAPIFQRLDLDIQMQVATRMKDRSMAAILSDMDPDSAKTLTTRLATRSELPDVTQLLEEKTPPSD